MDLNQKPNTLVLFYDELHGDPKSDGLCEEFLKFKLEEMKELQADGYRNNEVVEYISTENVILAARCMKKDGKLPMHIAIRVRNQNSGVLCDYYINEDGNMDFYPLEISALNKYLNKLAGWG